MTNLDVNHRHEGTDHEYVSIGNVDTPLHVRRDKDGDVIVYVHDHLTLRLTGEKKNEPLATVKSDEYPTRLRIVENESRFIRN